MFGSTRFHTAPPVTVELQPKDLPPALRPRSCGITPRWISRWHGSPARAGKARRSWSPRPGASVRVPLRRRAGSNRAGGGPQEVDIMVGPWRRNAVSGQTEAGHQRVTSQPDSSSQFRSPDLVAGAPTSGAVPHRLPRRRVCRTHRPWPSILWMRQLRRCQSRSTEQRHQVRCCDLVHFVSEPCSIRSGSVWPLA
jgi:hypothetical protein